MNSIPSDWELPKVFSSYRIHSLWLELAASAGLLPRCSSFGWAATLALTADLSK